MKIALAQINPIVGDLEYNSNKVLEFARNASSLGAQMVVFPELAICGYPPKDLLLKKHFIQDCKSALNNLATKIKEINPALYVVIGFPEENPGKGKPVFNSQAIISKGKVIDTVQKTLLPTYDVYDEDRYFETAEEIKPRSILSKSFGFHICEDSWHTCRNETTANFQKNDRYFCDPVEILANKGIDFLINSSASPFFFEKPDKRIEKLQATAKKYEKPYLYINQVGANDELIFDGNSVAINEKGEVICRLKSFEEDLQIVDFSSSIGGMLQSLTSKISLIKPKLSTYEELRIGLTVGIREYVHKTGFKKVLIGISGGIDSALVAALAVQALGKENVMGIFMPSRFTSDNSKNDSEALASNLGIELKTLSIEDPFKSTLKLLEGDISKDSLTTENIQPRLRGLILMALSNETSALLLSTGNKSELATGYCTLYGDMCGALSVISDLTKTKVYNLAKHINKSKAVIPQNIIDKAPTAELKENQTDQDTLPDYETLDKIIEFYTEKQMSIREIIATGLSEELVLKICKMIDRNEYKRKQTAPGLKMTNRAFGFGWRMPIAQQYTEQ